MLAVCSASYGFGVHSVLLTEQNLLVVYHVDYPTTSSYPLIICFSCDPFEETTYLLSTDILKFNISLLLLLLHEHRALL